MFGGVYQKQLLSILYSCGSKPLALWECKAKNGHIKRITDNELGNSLVLELTGTNVATTFVASPANPHASLGIKLRYLCMLVKNLQKYFSFEVTILDDKNVRRRLRASNYQCTSRIRPFCCSMPLSLNAGWNRIHFDLADFCRRAFNTTYVECVRVQIHANCRVRRVYLSEYLYSENDLPASYCLNTNTDPHPVPMQMQ